MIRACSILVLLAAFVVYWLRIYLTSEALPAVDLPGHVTLFEYLKEHALSPFGFYDPRFFGGYPALTFYGPLPAAVTVGAAAMFGISCQLAANCFMVGLLALLPFAILFAAAPFHAEADNDKNYWLLGLWVAAVSFWFINHDNQWYGIGAAAITNIGLYSQLFAWFPLLFIIGLVARELRQESFKNTLNFTVLNISIALGLLFYTHTVTFAFAAGYLCFMGLTQRRFWYLITPLCGLIIAFPYSFYFLSNVSEYAPFDIYSPKGDFLEITFRYPLIGLWDAIKTFVNSGIAPRISLLEVLLYPLAVYLLLNAKSNRGHAFKAQLSFLFVSVLLCGSDFFAKSLGLSLHYYRFVALNFISILPLVVSGVFMVFSGLSRAKKTGAIISGILAIVALASQIALPHYEMRRIEVTANSPYLLAENEIVKKILELPAGSRVITEYFSDYTKFPFLSAHYIGTQIVRSGKIENAGGLFVQSAPTYKYAAAYLEGLHGDTYHVSQQIVPAKYQSPAELLGGLKKMGVTHVLGFKEELAEALKSLGAVEIFKQGRYFLFQLAEPVKVSQVTAPVIGYLDLKGTLPFRYLEQYLAEDPSRLSGCELVALTKLTDSAKVDFTLINSSDSHVKVEGVFKVIDFTPIAPLSHYSGSGDADRELVQFKRAKEYLNKVALQKPSIQPITEVSAPIFKLSEDGQEMRLSYLVPGARYRIAYSYFPFWKGPGLVRASYNQMVVFAGAEDVILRYGR